MSESKVEYFIQGLNARNTKKVAFVLVLAFIVYHGLIHLRNGSDSCRNLLSHGRFKGTKEWQPDCLLHRYTEMDTRRCFRYLAFWGNQNHFVFIGDTRLRDLYQTFVDYLRPKDDEGVEKSPRAENGTRLDVDLEYTDYKLRLRVNFVYAAELATAIDRISQWRSDVDPPIAIIASCAYKEFFEGNLTEPILETFKRDLGRLVKPIDDLVARKSKVLWKLLDPVDEDFFEYELPKIDDKKKRKLGAATKMPAMNRKEVDKWKNIRNRDLDKLNRAIVDVLEYSDGQIWSSGRLIANGLLDEVITGFRSSPLTLKHNMQILLNMYCNDNMNYNDGTCCSSSETYTTLQVVTYALLALCIAFSVAICIRRWCQKLRGVPVYIPLNQMNPDTVGAEEMDFHTYRQHSNNHSLEANEGGRESSHGGPHAGEVHTPIFALTSLAIIMAYFYLCDRTNYFMKENKHYSEFSFWIPVGYVFVLGLFFTEDSRFTQILHRDQTDEVKGWMLLVILIYHMTGADHIIPIYMHTKLLISGFLFLSGYSTFYYMFKAGDVGLVHFCQNLFRLNFSTIVLCLCMNRPYQFYYFVPLMSFWYCVLYFVLALPPQITAQSCEQKGSYQYLYLALKVIFLLALSTVFFMSEVFFERIFVTRPWRALFLTSDDDIHEWWHRWKLDRYTVAFGVIFAILIHIGQKFNIFDDNNHGNLFSRRVSLLGILVGLVSIGFYLVFSIFCQNKQNCEEIHSYIVFIPICGYIVLRNLSGILRTRYSEFFAWFGRISFELFICQYHIWLAADRHGVLVLLPGFPTLNMIIVSFIFVCASSEVHRLTQVLLPYAVPSDWKLVLRNLIAFFIILIPIARYDGMF